VAAEGVSHRGEDAVAEVGFAAGREAVEQRRREHRNRDAFLNGGLDFLGIPAVIETALERLPGGPVRAFESLYEADREARTVASELIAVRT